jgi:hypothetical protein
MNVDEIVEALSTTEEKASGADPHFEAATNSLKEASNALAQASQGTTDHQATQAQELLAEAAGTLEQLRGLAKRVVAKVSSYRTSLQGNPPPAPDAPRQPTTSPPPSTEPPEVAAARTELPPPVVKGTRTRTHGQWSSSDAPADRRSIASGTRDDFYADTQRYLQENGMGQTVIGSHVETKIAVHMRQEGIRDVTVVTNHQPCEGPLGCDTLLPRVLPEGSTLTVYGTTQDGRHTKHTYIGRQGDS